MDPDPVEDGRLDDVDALPDPVWVSLVWDDDADAWVVSTNAEDGDDAVATACSWTLYKLAMHELGDWH